ncbi:PepSY domain-containing protein [Cellvibrio sp. NN19]|uniref:PepSY domain-containing protein n=1 Tax=Cellvibrio chitinivorans TaxID=3102792 RepID=UPI002B404FA1|nr:PepSY domain-containing protein [Cellvibrio sp. NN19]
MHTITRLLIYFFLAALTLGVSARDLSQDEALRLREQGRIIPLEKLLELVAQRHPQASLLEVELEEDDDIYIYEVELATKDGVIRELEFDAHTGTILKDEEDD